MPGNTRYGAASYFLRVPLQWRLAPKHSWKSMETIIRRFEGIGLALAGLCLCLLMLTVSADALMRYGFNSPLPWVTEVSSYYLLVGATYLAISATFTHGDHINIDLLRHLLSPRLRATTDALCALMYLAVFALLGYLVLGHVTEAFSHEQYMPGYIAWPMWLSYAPIPLGVAILCARLIHHVYMLATRGQDPHVVLHHGAEEGIQE